MQGKKNKCGGRTVKVKVTRKNIDRGEFGSTEYCPIALAMEDAGFSASVDDIRITLTDPDTENEVVITTPSKLAAFIGKFDAIEDVEAGNWDDEDYDEKCEQARIKAKDKLKPFSFEVLLPGPATIKA